MGMFQEEAWADRFRVELESDVGWREAARYFPARIDLRDDDGSLVLDTRDGAIASVAPGPHPLGADLTLSAPNAEWRRLAEGRTDWFQSTSPGTGEVSLEGNVIGALRNVKAMWLLFGVISRLDNTAAPVEPSPDPRPTGITPEGKYLDVERVRTFYEVAGEGPPLVCFHAACQDTLMYRQVLEGIADSYRVYAIDAPGHGKTLLPAGGAYSDITRHAEFEERVMELLGLEQPSILGCSMGGNLVLELAARRPHAYAAVISAEGADFTPTVSDLTLEMLLMNGSQIVECWSQSLTGSRTPPDRAREVVWQIRRATPEVMAGDLGGYAGFDKRDAMGAIESPVLLLRGDADWLVSQDQVDATAARIRDCEVTVLAGTGHYPMIENPFEFNQAVREFLDARVPR